MASQRGQRGIGALVVVTAVVLVLVWRPYDCYPAPLGRWIAALVLVVVGAVVMTQAPDRAAASPRRAAAALSAGRALTMAGDSATAASRPQQAAKAALALLLTGLGLWTLHRYLPALIWAAILAIAVWPLYQRAVRRWPPGKHNILLPSVFTLALALVFIIPLVLVAVQAGKEVHGVYDAIAKARTEGIPPPEWLGHLPVGSQQATHWWQENLTNPDSAEGAAADAPGSRSSCRTAANWAPISRTGSCCSASRC